MASAAQITANRANATHSTGPVDTSRTRFNGLAHGLTSKQTVVRGESQEEFDIFATKLRKELKPGSETESMLVERIISAAWRLKRFGRVEASFFNNRIDAFLAANPDSDPDSALASLFTDPAEMARMRLFLRYQTSVQREYDTAMREFKKAQAERAKSDCEKLALGIADLYTEESSQPVGFASQIADTSQTRPESRPAGAPFTRSVDFL